MRCSFLLSLFLLIAPFALGLSPQVEQALETGDRGTAIELLRKELKKNKRADEERMILGQLLVDAGEYGEAAKVWMKGVRKSPLDREYLIAVGNLELMRAEYGPGVTQSGGFTSIIRTGEDPERFRKGRLKAAVKVLRRASEIEPPLLEADVLLLQALEGLEDWKAMLTHANKAADVNGPKAILELYQAKAMAGLGQDKDAMARLLNLAERHPETSEVHAEIAKVAARTGDESLQQSSRRRGEFLLPDFLQLEYSDERYAILAGLGVLQVHEDDQEWVNEQLGGICAVDGIESDAKDLRDCLLQHLIEAERSDSSQLLGILCFSHAAHGSVENRAFEILRERNERQMLLSILRNASSWCTVRGAGHALAELKHPEVFEELIQRLPSDGEALHHGNVAGALVKLGDGRAVPHLAAVVTKPTPEVSTDDFLAYFAWNGGLNNRVRSALALGHFPGEQSVQALELGLKDELIAPACAAALFRLTGDVAYLQTCLDGLEDSEIMLSILTTDAEYWATVPEAKPYLQRYQALVEQEKREMEKERK